MYQLGRVTRDEQKYDFSSENNKQSSVSNQPNCTRTVEEVCDALISALARHNFSSGTLHTHQVLMQNKPARKFLAHSNIADIAEIHCIAFIDFTSKEKEKTPSVRRTFRPTVTSHQVNLAKHILTCSRRAERRKYSM